LLSLLFTLLAHPIDTKAKIIKNRFFIILPELTSLARLNVFNSQPNLSGVYITENNDNLW